MTPLVSVIIPAYNAEGVIGETLESIRRQVYRNIEVIVVNDGSSDHTVEIVQAICKHDHRVKLLHQPRSGVAAARNTAIRHAKGEFIAPIDADDIWHPMNIEKQLECMLQSDETVGMTYAWSLDINEKGFPTGGFRVSNIKGYVYETLLSHNFLGNASASLIRRTCFEKIGGYSEQYRQANAQGCEDWDLYLRIAEQYRFQVVPEFLIGYRRMKNCMSKNYRTMAKSHRMMLDKVLCKYPNIYDIFFRLSTVSLYAYFDEDSSQNQAGARNMYWVRLSLQKDYILALLLHGFSKFISPYLKQTNSCESPARSASAHAIDSVPDSMRAFKLCGNCKMSGVKFRALLSSFFHIFVKKIVSRHDSIVHLRSQRDK